MGIITHEAKGELIVRGFDRETLEKELRSLESPEACALIAARCALRVQPLLLRRAEESWFGRWWATHAENCCAGILVAWAQGTSVISRDTRLADAAARSAAADADAAARSAAARSVAAAADAAVAVAAAAAFAAADAAAAAAAFAADAHDRGAAVVAAARAARAAFAAADADYAAEGGVTSTDVIAADLGILKSAGPERLRDSGLWPTEAPSNRHEPWRSYLARLADLDGLLPELLQGIADGKGRPEEVARWLEAWFDRRQAGGDRAGSGDTTKKVDPQADAMPPQDTTETVLVQESVFINQGQAAEEIAGSAGADEAGLPPGDSPPEDATDARRASASVARIQPEGLASQDCLGRERVVEALAQLVAEREGERHLALGLFGPWGSGKSSTIAQLSAALRDTHPEIRTAEFNAWKNEKATNLGAMLAQAVVDSLTQDLGLKDKMKLAMRLNLLRRARQRQAVARDVHGVCKWLEGWAWLVLPPLLTLIGVLVLIWALPLNLGHSGVLWPQGVASLAAFFVVAYRGVAGFLERNLTSWFARLGVEQPASLLRLPDYAGERGILGEIHLTLTQLCSLCLGREKVAADGRPRQLLLVVDDLDRCGINTVKEVLDAVRLVVDIPHVTTLIAIDERMAFAAVEKHYDQFGHAGRPPAQVAREYLAKVLQVSLALPAVDRDGVRQYVDEQLFQGVAWLENEKPVVLGSDDFAPEGGSLPGQRPDAGEAAGPSEMPGDAPLPPGPAPVPAPGADSLPLAAWPAEKTLFCDLVDAYAFGNPRLMLRLEITWRLLKSLWFGKTGYRYEDAEILLRLLFWREYRLQQTPERSGALDAWLVSGEENRFPEELRAEPEKLRAALGSLPDLLKQGTIIELPAEQVLATVDAVLLPAAPPRPETTPKPEAIPKPVAQSKPVARAKQKAQAQAAGSAKA